MENKKGLLRIGVILLLISFLVVAIVFDANHSVKRILSDSIHQTMKEVAEQQSFTIYREIATDLGALENIALLWNPADRGEQQATLEELMAHTDFSAMALIGVDGRGIDHKGNPVDLSRQEIFQRTIAGETVIGSFAGNLFGDKLTVPIAVPIYHGGDKPGYVLIGAYSVDKLHTFILPSFSGEGKSFLINGEGKMLIKAENSEQAAEELTFDELFHRMKIISGSSRSRVLSDLSEGEPGHMVFDMDGDRWHCHYSPVGLGGWYIFTVLGYDVGAAYASVISIRLAVMAAMVAGCFLFCIVYIFYQQRRYTTALERAAYYDELCDCPNLAKFRMDAQKYVDGHPNARVVLVRLDIAEFKLLNQILDKETGNRVLVNIAKAFRQITPTGCFCRVHDDEFCAMFDCGKPDEIDKIREAFLERLMELMGSGFSYPIRIIAGHYYMSFEQCKSVAEGLEKANIAHRKAKELGLNVCVYDEAFVRRALWNKQIENQMEGALANGEFLVYLQAQYTLSDESVSSAEALIRWNSVKDGLISPGEFIPVLEEKGLITKLDFYVWEQVCKTLRKWMDAGIPPIEISVNFSRKHLSNPNFVEDLCKTADKYRIPHQLLAVELTESVICESEEMLLEMAEQLHERGFKLSMDDFGTGYSSLSVLKNLPVDILKIDRSFFTDNHYKTRAKRLIAGVMKMAEQLRMTTIAEGVEQEEYIVFLQDVGCDKVQGYFYERPVPMDTFWEREKKVHLSESQADQRVELSLGDIEAGRGGLGDQLPVSVYRLLHFSMREVLKQRYGDGEMVEILRGAGWIAGRHYARENLDLTLSWTGFLDNMKTSLRESKIGILEIGEVREDKTRLELTLFHDPDCSGTENEDKKLCQYDEGFFAGILYEYTHKTYSVTEMDCWANGADACRFLAAMR